MTLPFRLLSAVQFRHLNAKVQFTFAVLFGLLIAIAGFNFVLSTTLKQLYGLYYSFYILCFILVNISYNGYGFAWIYPHGELIQKYATQVLMLFHGISGLMFVCNFLSTSKYIPKIHKVIQIAVTISIVIAVLLVLNGKHLLLTLFAFKFLFASTLTMIAVSLMSLGKVSDARYFLIAIMCSMMGLLATSFSVWGLIPYNFYTFNASKFGVICEAIILCVIVTKRLNVIERKRISAEYLSAYDPLTNLFNRRAFMKVGHQLLVENAKHNPPVSFVMIDIDHFKKINDTYGHQTGDQVLKHIADLLKNNCRHIDIIARWGGEEIVLLLPHTNKKQAIACTEHLRDTIEQSPLYIQGQAIRVTASFGIAVSERGDSFEQLYQYADQALYEAKHQGRNRIAFY